MKDTVEISGKLYRFNSDVSWQKWKRIESRLTINEIERLKWFTHNVFIDQPEDFRIARALMKAIRIKLGLSDKQQKQLRKSAGKVGRGQSIVPELQSEVVEYKILTHFKGAVTYSDLRNNLSFRKVIFWYKMIESIEKEKEKELEKLKNAKK